MTLRKVTCNTCGEVANWADEYGPAYSRSICKCSSRTQVLPLVEADLRARIEKGAIEYGEPLTTHNGRDALWDLYEELLDAALYTRQLIEERR